MEEKRTAKIIPVLFSMNWQHRPEHLKIKHKKDISRYSEEVIQTTGPLNSTHYLTHMGAGADCFHSSFYVVDHQFKEKPEPSWCVGPFKQGERKFFQYMYFHVKKEIAQIWILFYGSRTEAENLKCRLFFGKFNCWNN